MKEFRQSFRKTRTAFDVKVLVILFVLLFLPAIWIVKSSIPAILGVIVFLLITFHLLVIQLFYVILTDDKLIIKNGVYPFWEKEAWYIDIVKLRFIWYGGRSYPSMKVITKKSSKMSWRYTIDYVDPQDYSIIVEELKKKGVPVETKDLDMFVDMFKEK